MQVQEFSNLLPSFNCIHRVNITFSVTLNLSKECRYQGSSLQYEKAVSEKYYPAHQEGFKKKRLGNETNIQIIVSQEA